MQYYTCHAAYKHSSAVRLGTMTGERSSGKRWVKFQQALGLDAPDLSLAIKLWIYRMGLSKCMRVCTPVYPLDIHGVVPLSKEKCWNVCSTLSVASGQRMSPGIHWFLEQEYTLITAVAYSLVKIKMTSVDKYLGSCLTWFDYPMRKIESLKRLFLAPTCHGWMKVWSFQ